MAEWLAGAALTALLCYMAMGAFGFTFQVIAVVVLGFVALGASEQATQQRKSSR